MRTGARVHVVIDDSKDRIAKLLDQFVAETVGQCVKQSRRRGRGREVEMEKEEVVRKGQKVEVRVDIRGNVWVKEFMRRLL